MLQFYFKSIQRISGFVLEPWVYMWNESSEYWNLILREKSMIWGYNLYQFNDILRHENKYNRTLWENKEIKEFYDPLMSHACEMLFISILVFSGPGMIRSISKSIE